MNNLLDESSIDIVKELIKQAKAGDLTAINIFLKKVVADLRSQEIAVDLTKSIDVNFIEEGIESNDNNND